MDAMLENFNHIGRGHLGRFYLIFWCQLFVTFFSQKSQRNLRKTYERSARLSCSQEFPPSPFTSSSLYNSLHIRVAIMARVIYCMGEALTLCVKDVWWPSDHKGRVKGDFWNAVSTVRSLCEFDKLCINSITNNQPGKRETVSIRAALSYEQHRPKWIPQFSFFLEGLLSLLLLSLSSFPVALSLFCESGTWLISLKEKKRKAE